MDLHTELLSFADELKEYKDFLEKPNSEPSDKIKKKAFPIDAWWEQFPFLKKYAPLRGREEIIEKIREKLLVKAGQLSARITELSGADEITIYEFGQPRSVNVWAMGLRAEYDYRTAEALNACIDYTLRAIGKLELDIEEGIRAENGKIVEKLGETTMAAEAIEHRERREQAQSLGKEIRKYLHGTPEEIAPHIIRVANEIKFSNGYNCYAEEETYKTSPFSKKLSIYRITGCYTPGAIWPIEDEERPHIIGGIMLQSLPNNKTILIGRYKLPATDNERSYFDSFLERLSLEFKNLGIEETTVQKTWRWFNKIIELWSKLKP